MPIIRSSDWDVIRAYAHWLTQFAQGRNLDLPDTPPKTIEGLRILVNSWAMEHRFDQTLELTTDALADAAGSLAAAHRVAAAIKVLAPTAQQAGQLETDLRSLGEFVKRNQRAAAISAFFASAAEALRSARSA
jgi:hypothetical protein